MLGQIQWQGNKASSYTVGKAGNHPLQARADAEEQSPLPGMPFFLVPLETIIALVTRGRVSGTLTNVPGAAQSAFRARSHRLPTTAQHGAPVISQLCLIFNLTLLEGRDGAFLSPSAKEDTP